MMPDDITHGPPPVPPRKIPQPEHPCQAAAPPERASRPTTFSTPSYLAAPMNCSLSVATDAEYVRVSGPRRPLIGSRSWRRGSITHFSARSRSRMLQSIAQVRRTEQPPDAQFVTLTYPAWYPTSTRECKEQLRAWEKRLRRLCEAAWFYWKLEFQVRGAPHFHLLLFNAGTVSEETMHTNWFEVVNSGEEHHWFYGTDVKRLDSWTAAGRYCAKYVAKEDTQQIVDGVGRFWGIANRAARDAYVASIAITEREFYMIRRTLLRYMHRPAGVSLRGGSDSGVWTRLPAADAKRLLDLVSRSLGCDDDPANARYVEYGSSRDTHPFDTDSNSRDGPGEQSETTTDRNADSARLPLYDRRDAQAARARRLQR